MRLRNIGLFLIAAAVVAVVSILVWQRLAEARFLGQLEPYWGRDLGELPAEDRERVDKLVGRIAPGLGRPGDYGNAFSLWYFMPIQTERGQRYIAVAAYTGSLTIRAPLYRCILFDARLRRLHESEFAGARDCGMDGVLAARPEELGCNALEILAERGRRISPPLYVSAEGDRLSHAWGKDVDWEGMRKRDDARRGKVFSREDVMRPPDERQFPREEKR